jgi:hypothetical protein
MSVSNNCRKLYRVRLVEWPSDVNLLLSQMIINTHLYSFIERASSNTYSALDENCGYSSRTQVGYYTGMVISHSWSRDLTFIQKPAYRASIVYVNITCKMQINHPVNMYCLHFLTGNHGCIDYGSCRCIVTLTWPRVPSNVIKACFGKSS